MFLREDSVERRHVCRALVQFWAERNVEQIVDIDGDAREELAGSVQIAANIPEVVETTLQGRIWCIFEEVDNFPVPQFVEENHEVINRSAFLNVPWSSRFWKRPSFPSFRQKLLR